MIPAFSLTLDDEQTPEFAYFDHRDEIDIEQHHPGTRCILDLRTRYCTMSYAKALSIITLISDTRMPTSFLITAEAPVAQQSRASRTSLVTATAMA